MRSMLGPTRSGASLRVNVGGQLRKREEAAGALLHDSGLQPLQQEVGEPAQVRRAIVQDLLVFTAGAQVLADAASGEIARHERFAVVLQPLAGGACLELSHQAGVAAVEDEQLMARAIEAA